MAADGDDERVYREEEVRSLVSCLGELEQNAQVGTCCAGYLFGLRERERLPPALPGVRGREREDDGKYHKYTQ